MASFKELGYSKALQLAEGYNFTAPSVRPLRYSRWSSAKIVMPGATTITYTAAMRGQAHWPIPPEADASTTGMVRTIWSLVSVAASRYSPQAVTKLTIATTTTPLTVSGSST